MLKFNKVIVGLVFAVMLALGAGSALGQSGRRLPSNNRPQQDDTLRLRAEEVLLNVTVTDPYSRQATDLTKSEFIIAEDGQRRRSPAS